MVWVDRGSALSAFKEICVVSLLSEGRQKMMGKNILIEAMPREVTQRR
jgi:hypothetical protein